MFIWFKKDRCKICAEERAIRYCLRRNKDLGWSCCNSYRSDSKCPDQCPYTPQKGVTKSPLPQIKTDSRTELLDFLDRYLQYWKHSEISDFGGKTPQQLSENEEGRAILKEWLQGFTYPDREILILLKEKLKLDLNVPEEKTPHPEKIAADFLAAVIEQDWEKVIAFYPYAHDFPADIYYLFKGTLNSNSLLKKVKSFSLINAGLTEDRKQSFVFCEVNGRDSLTIIYNFAETKWILQQVVIGNLQDYYAQRELYRNIADALSNQNDTLALSLLREIENRLPLSPDLFYYYGLFYTLIKDTKSARKSFIQALAMEPGWHLPIQQLALVYMNEKEFRAAIKLFEKLIINLPDDINTLNNLGVCYIGINQSEQAKSIWNKALQINPNSEVIKKNLEHYTHG